MARHSLLHVHSWSSIVFSPVWEQESGEVTARRQGKLPILSSHRALFFPRSIFTDFYLILPISSFSLLSLTSPHIGISCSPSNHLPTPTFFFSSQMRDGVEVQDPFSTSSLGIVLVAAASRRRSSSSPTPMGYCWSWCTVPHLTILSKANQDQRAQLMEFTKIGARYGRSF